MMEKHYSVKQVRRIDDATQKDSSESSVSHKKNLASKPLGVGGWWESGSCARCGSEGNRVLHCNASPARMGVAATQRVVDRPNHMRSSFAKAADVRAGGAAVRGIASSTATPVKHAARARQAEPVTVVRRGKRKVELQSASPECLVDTIVSQDPVSRI